jgi:type I restriction enzyme S subunit
MPAVSESGRGITKPQLRPFREIRKGYTWFVEGDVLFAKITPCMENGKHAIARDLTDGIGFGSTEFHVCRPGATTIPEWIHFFLLQPWVIQNARANFTGAVGQQRVPEAYLAELELPFPPLSEQRRIAARLHEQLADVAQARAAVQAQNETLDIFAHAVLRQSLSNGNGQKVRFSECLREVTVGIGEEWQQYPVLGATRAGLAPAKESVGKNPGRYKPVREGTIFYNPMRILLGSIAMVDEGDQPGITSPDYVVMNSIEDRLNPRWFYHWFRSRYGVEFIKSMTRGAVRERLMFRRLAPVSIVLPDLKRQEAAARQFAEIRKAKANLAEKLDTLERIPAALLREAFNGKVASAETERVEA